MSRKRLTYITENIHQLNKVDRVVGCFLYDLSREMIARIDGVLFDPEAHRVHYIVINQGGFLDIRGKKTLVPRAVCELVDLGEIKTSWSGQSLRDAPSPEDIYNVTSDEEELIMSYFNLSPC